MPRNIYDTAGDDVAVGVSGVVLVKKSRSVYKSPVRKINDHADGDGAVSVVVVVVVVVVIVSIIYNKK